jgi:hypothetical protein
VLAASHELAHGGMGAARVLLQRGLRLNADCVDMWREYVRLELGFVEALRRRWDVLGISLEEDDDDDSSPDRETQGERVDRAEEEGMGDTARRAIMDGAIVRQAIDGAAKGEQYLRSLFVHSFTASLHCLFLRDQRCRRSSCFRICRRLLPNIRQQSLSATRCWITSTRDWLRCCRVTRLPWHCVQHGCWLSLLQGSLRGVH